MSRLIRVFTLVIECQRLLPEVSKQFGLSLTDQPKTQNKLENGTVEISTNTVACPASWYTPCLANRAPIARARHHLC